MVRRSCFHSAMGGLALLMCGCASQAQAPNLQAADASSAALACALPTQCVNSLDGGGLGPLRYQGTPLQALAVLRTTLAEFPEAQIVSADGLSLQAVFTTPLGFRDLVDFRLDAQAQRIDYRSRSSFGLFDFGKNRSRMTAFSKRFEQNARR
jgi:uncharacterized protein (DUF1499 family)